MEALLHPDIDLSWQIFLVGLSFVTSFITASMGIGGGTIMLAAMAQLLPTLAIVPVHGMVQLGSNGGRAILMREHIQWDLLLWFSLGALAGALIGGQIVISLNTQTLQLILGAFILFLVWAPKPSFKMINAKSLAAGGLLTTILTMFVSATGPLVLAILKAVNSQDRVWLVANNSAYLVVQHLLKVLVFGFLGFNFGDYLGLIALMILTGFIGTWIGKRALLKTNEASFQRVLNVLLTLLACRLIYAALLAE